MPESGGLGMRPGNEPGNEDGSGGPEMRLCTGSCLSDILGHIFQMFQIEGLNVRLGIMLFIGGFEEDCALLTPVRRVM